MVAGFDTQFLTGLRGIAALLVVVSHSASAGLLPIILGNGLGQTGVAIFFVLSGYLMGLLYLRRPFKGAIRGYIVARIARIAPPYALAVLVFAAASQAGVPFFFDFPGPAIWRSLTLRLGHEHLWTIPVEVHYYVVFTLLWAISARCGTWAFAAISVLLGALLFGLATALVAQGPVINAVLIFWAPFFIVGTLLGAAGAPCIQRLRAGYAQTWPVALPVLGLLVLLLVPGVRRELGIPVIEHWRDPWVWSGVMAVCTLASCNRWVGQCLSAKPLQWLGGVSFSLYLFHPPCIELAVHYFGGGSRLSAAVGAAVTLSLSLAVAVLVQTWVERPSRAFIRKLGAKAPTPGLMGQG